MKKKKSILEISKITQEEIWEYEQMIKEGERLGKEKERREEIRNLVDCISRAAWDSLSMAEKEAEYTRIYSVLTEYFEERERQGEKPLELSKWKELDEDEKFMEYVQLLYNQYLSARPKDIYIDGDIVWDDDVFLDYFEEPIAREDEKRQQAIEREAFEKHRTPHNNKRRKMDKVDVYEALSEMDVDPEVIDDMSLDESIEYLKMLRDEEE